MFEKEITAGMKLLDEKMPGWHEKVDPVSLDLNNCTACVLGQLTGDYYSDEAAKLLAIDPIVDERYNSAVVHGFAADLDALSCEGIECMDDNEAAYAQLTTEWREAITGRRGEVK